MDPFTLLMGMGQMGLSAIPAMTGLYDRFVTRTSPYVEQARDFYANQFNQMSGNNPYGDPYSAWGGMFGTRQDGSPIGAPEAMGYSMFDQLNMYSPQQAAMDNYGQLAQMQAPPVMDATRGMANLLGYGDVGFRQPQAQFNPAQAETARPTNFTNNAGPASGGQQLVPGPDLGDELVRFGLQQFMNGNQQQSAAASPLPVNNLMPPPQQSTGAFNGGYDDYYGASGYGGGFRAVSPGDLSQWTKGRDMTPSGGASRPMGPGDVWKDDGIRTSSGTMAQTLTKPFPNPSAPSASVPPTGQPPTNGQPGFPSNKPPGPQPYQAPERQEGMPTNLPMLPPPPNMQSGAQSNPMQLFQNPYANESWLLDALERNPYAHQTGLLNALEQNPYARETELLGNLEQAPTAQRTDLVNQIEQNPVSMGQDVQNMIFNRAADQMSRGTEGMERQIRNQAQGSGATGAHQRRLFDLEQNRQKQLSDLQRDIGIQAASTNFNDLQRSAGLVQGVNQAQFGDLTNVANLLQGVNQNQFGNLANTAGMMQGVNQQQFQNLGNTAGMMQDVNQQQFGNLANTANMQFGMEQGLGQMMNQQNAMNQGAYNNQFGNMGRIIDQLANYGNSDLQRQLGLWGNLTGQQLGGMAYPNAFLDQALRTELARITPSPIAQFPAAAFPQGGGGGGGSQGGGGDQGLSQLMQSLGMWAGSGFPSPWS